MDLQVVPLHRYPEHLQQCCELINKEWKRSITARMRSLECSCDALPTCLILLKENKVIGHCKVSSIPSTPNSCFLESVVIEQSARGMGYGKYFMMRTEEYCKNVLNLRSIYLSTHGQELFYSKIGYNQCQPISIYGSSSMASSPIYHNNYVNTCKVIQKHEKCPIPPPMPTNTTNFTYNHKVYMKKVL